MPRSPLSPRLPFTSFDEVAAAVREQGGRLSAPRRAVLELLFAAEGPVSAEHLARALTDRGDDHDLSSVYRTLEYLERLGVARHVHIGHGPGLFALVGGGEREYLACERCDRVTSVDPASLDPIRDLIRETFGYTARFSHFPIVGICDQCAAEPHAHEHTLHEHEHSHGNLVHSHPRVPRDGHEH